MTNKKNYYLYFISQSISKIGSSILDFAIIWTMVLKFDSTTPFLISLLVTYLPKMIMAILMERLSLNNHHKTLIILGDLFVAGISVMFLIVDIGELKLIYLLIFLRSLGSGVIEPYSQSIIVYLFDKKELKKVNTINSFLKSVVSLLVPSITGLLISIIPLTYIPLIDTLTAIVSVVLVGQLDVKYDSELSSESTETVKNKESLSRLAKQLLYINSFYYFFMTVPGYMTALLVKHVFGGELFFLNLNETVWTSGMIVGALIVSKIKMMSIKWYTFSIIGYGVLTLGMSFSFNFVFYLTLLLLSGVFYVVYGILNSLIVQKNLSKKDNDRYWVVESLFINISIPIGMIFFGWANKFLVIDYVFILSAVGIITTGLVAAFSINKYNVNLTEE